jgi:hypothetical protein
VRYAIQNRIVFPTLLVLELGEKRLAQAMTFFLIIHRPTVELPRSQSDLWLPFGEAISTGAMR